MSLGDLDVTATHVRRKADPGPRPNPVVIIAHGLVWLPLRPAEVEDLDTADLVQLAETGSLPSPFERAMVRGLMRGFGFGGDDA